MRQVFNVMMAAVLVVLLSLGSVGRGFAQGGAGRPFITKWQGKAGEELKFPIVGTEYKLVIKNEKGEVVKSEEKVTVEGTDESFYHAFTPTADGVYTVEAGPEGVKYMQMRAKWDGKEGKWHLLTSNAQLLKVVQFGTVAWESMDQMFLKCEKMTFAADIDTPDLTKVTDMSGMFAFCYAFNQPLNNWAVSQVTHMIEMFYDCRAFNQPLGKWDVSKVTNMDGMFEGCRAFNQPLGKWKLQTAIGALSSTAMSTVNYSLSLIGWAKQTDCASNIKFGRKVSGLVYNDAGKEAREKLIARGWTFEGDIFYQLSKEVAISLDKKGEGILAIEDYNDAALQKVAVRTELTVIATPKEGYMLTSLTAGTQDILATKKFTVTEAVEVKAVFKKKVAITLAKEGEGTLAIEGYTNEALKAVIEGTELTVIATPKDGYTLTSLTAGTQDIFATKKFTVTKAMEVKAVFKKKVAITLAKEGEGTLAIEGYTNEALQAVIEGTELTVIATPQNVLS